MPFLASNTIPQDAYQRTKRTAVSLKANCQGFVTQLAAANANYSFLRDIYMTLKNANAFFETMKAVPGIGDYAKAQENDAAYNVAAEFTAMQGAIATAVTWMNSNVPTSVTAITPANWTDNGPMIATEFTPAQTATLRTHITAVANSIA